jgi:hypothetical protein
MAFDVEALLDHLDGNLQFYGARGQRDNAGAIADIRRALRSFDGELPYKYSRRFELVKHIVGKRLEWGFVFDRGRPAHDELGKQVVELADAVLAAMDATPDAGPSAEEVQEEIIEIDEDGVVHGVGEKPNLAIVLAIRAQIQTHLDGYLKFHAENPTTNVRELGFRSGGSHRSKHILEMIDAAMEKTGEAENDDGN